MAWAVYLRQSMVEEKVPSEHLFISGYLFAFFFSKGGGSVGRNDKKILEH